MTREWAEIATETWIWTNESDLPKVTRVTKTWGERWDLVPASMLPCPVVHQTIAFPETWQLRIPGKGWTKYLFVSAESARNSVEDSWTVGG